MWLAFLRTSYCTSSYASPSQYASNERVAFVHTLICLQALFLYSMHLMFSRAALTHIDLQM